MFSRRASIGSNDGRESPKIKIGWFEAGLIFDELKLHCLRWLSSMVLAENRYDLLDVVCVTNEMGKLDVDFSFIFLVYVYVLEPIRPKGYHICCRDHRR